MIVKVFYPDDTTGVLEIVAEIYAGMDTRVMDALELAFCNTQNINGSWSRGPTFEGGEINLDYNPRIAVMKPLEVFNGEVYGHRSSMMGDIFEIEGCRYEVATFGFNKI